MANTRQTTPTRGWDVEERIMHNHELVREHIDDLLREGAMLRAERMEAQHGSWMGPAVAGRTRRTLSGAGGGALRPARLRLGAWLVALGWAVAGCPGESRGAGEQARRVA